MALTDSFIELQTNLLADEFRGGNKTAPKEAIESLAPYLVKYPTRFMTIGGSDIGYEGKLHDYQIEEYIVANRKWQAADFHPLDRNTVDAYTKLQTVMLPDKRFMVCCVKYRTVEVRTSKVFIFNPYAKRENTIESVWGPGEKVFACRDGSSLLALSGGRVLRIGGLDPIRDSAVAGWKRPRHMILDVLKDDWKGIDLPIPFKYEMGCVVLQNGDILMTGGYTVIYDNIHGPASLDLTTRSDCYIIDHTLTKAQPTSDMINSRTDHGICLMENGNVFVCGGSNEQALVLTTCEEYNITTKTWSVLPDMPVRKYGHTCLLMDGGKIFIAGGGGQACHVTMIYDPSTKTFDRLPDYPLRDIYGFKVIPVYD
jgi:hypothetical protein